MIKPYSRLLPVFLCGLVLVVSCAGEQTRPAEQSFTLAMIPDTQNYVDYTRQKATGFVIDGSELFIQQMEHIASRSKQQGGDIAFVASVGDVWQHYVSYSDPEHSKRGLAGMENDPARKSVIRPHETKNIEIPKAIEGYELISNAGIPFGVAPGNHDYDAVWGVTIPGYDQPLAHVGGLDMFRSAFGSETQFFEGKDWYVDGYNGGASSAQIFEAGGYRFLHFAFEMHAGDQVLDWAQSIIDANPGLPTIISTHEFINPQGERKVYPALDLALADPGFNNNPEQIWDKFIRRNDQIFMLLCGHRIGQALRIDDNDFGHKVYQILADYQGRGQAGLDAGARRNENGAVVGLGDGWLREMTFYLGGDNPRISVKTYSTFYRQYSDELETYAQWYRPAEQPGISDSDFLQLEEFTLDLSDFYTRFGLPVIAY